MKVALVTGAARGIGAATVGVLAAQGYRVVAADDCGRRPYRPQSHTVEPPTIRELRNLVARHPNAVATVADTANLEAMRVVCQETVARFGRLDVVVAAAAMIDGGPLLWDTAVDQLREILEVDALGVWCAAAAAVPYLIASPSPAQARFIAVTSPAARIGLYGLSSYTIAKHAAAGVIRALAADLTGTGVVALAVSPGSTDTSMLRATAQTYGVGEDVLVAHQDLGRALSAEDIASVISFACSPAGAAFAGGVLAAEGGFRG